ncbi:MAG: hypothetical protein J7K65_00980 [Planctomycetes bacterium]|nr:hypothetical protein [Planctomycetota bacterium]
MENQNSQQTTPASNEHRNHTDKRSTLQKEMGDRPGYIWYGAGVIGAGLSLLFGIMVFPYIFIAIPSAVVFCLFCFAVGSILDRLDRIERTTRRNQKLYEEIQKNKTS